MKEREIRQLVRSIGEDYYDGHNQISILESDIMALLAEIDGNLDLAPYEWVKENAPSLLEMSTPLTEKQAVWFSENYPEDIWQDIMERMENHVQLKKKYKSAKLTAQGWLRFRQWLPYCKMDTLSHFAIKDALRGNERAMEIYKNRRETWQTSTQRNQLN